MIIREDRVDLKGRKEDGDLQHAVSRGKEEDDDEEEEEEGNEDKDKEDEASVVEIMAE